VQYTAGHSIVAIHDLSTVIRLIWNGLI